MAGFMMYMLRRVPKLTDRVNYAGYRFEVVDVEGARIDQVLVTRIADNAAAAASEKKPETPAS